MVKTNYRDESQLYGFLRSALLRDLISLGWPSSVAGSILNWFDPRSEEYLQHVDSWQRSLCLGEILDSAVPPSVLSFMGSTCVESWSSVVVQQLHFIAKLFYKFRGKVRQPEGTCLESAKSRFARPGIPHLSTDEKRRLSRVLKTLRPPVLEKMLGSYGPGVTSDRLDNFARWCRDGVFPVRVPITAFIKDLNDYVAIGKIDYVRYGITKVAEVPKSIKSNRIVSAEYANFMWLQKAIGKHLSRELHKRFKGCISLHDAEKHNRLLYHHGFRSIDLSDASDHVTRTLIHQIFPPKWREVLFQARSSFARFPDGEIVPLRTFSPMGAGDTFEVLSAVCLAVCVCCCQHAFSVYGDDIIVYTDDYDRVVELLEHCGLVVNHQKSAQTTTYRESCGLELFNSLNITPLYIREDWRKTTASKLEVISQKCEGLLFNATREAILSEVSPLGRFRWNSDIQQMEVEVRTTVPPKTTRLPSEHGLFRWFCIKAEEQRVAERSNRCKTRWQYDCCDNYPSLLSYYIKHS